MSTREYNFIVGPETETIPTIGTPTNPDDLITLSYNKTVTGTRAAPIDIVAGTGITVNDVDTEIIFIQGSGGAVNISANPQIEASSVDGQELILFCRSDSNSVTLEDGDGLSLNGNFTMNENEGLYLVWDGSVWVETSRVVR